MTDTTAPRTAAGTWWRDDCNCDVTDAAGDGCPLTRDTDAPDGLCDHCRGHAEAIEPLLALVRALTSISPFDYEQGLCYWCGGGWEDVTGPRGGKRPPAHTGLHKDDCPFLRAALLAHAPESVRVAARKS